MDDFVGVHKKWEIISFIYIQKRVWGYNLFCSQLLREIDGSCLKRSYLKQWRGVDDIDSNKRFYRLFIHYC